MTTRRARPGMPSPHASVADNDLNEKLREDAAAIRNAKSVSGGTSGTKS
jgi:hypothetical protein